MFRCGGRRWLYIAKIPNILWTSLCPEYFPMLINWLVFLAIEQSKLAVLSFRDWNNLFNSIAWVQHNVNISADIELRQCVVLTNTRSKSPPLVDVSNDIVYVLCRLWLWKVSWKIWISLLRTWRRKVAQELAWWSSYRLLLVIVKSLKKWNPSAKRFERLRSLKHITVLKDNLGFGTSYLTVCDIWLLAKCNSS